MSDPTSISNLLTWNKAGVGMYTDTAGTVPVANDGDLIALWKDQSGNGFDRVQATSGARLKWDALCQLVQNEYNEKQWMPLGSGVAFNSQGFTIGYVGQLVTIRSGCSSNANTSFTVLLEGTGDAANFYYTRGGRLATYDGSTVRNTPVGNGLLSTSRIFLCMTSSASGTTIYVGNNTGSLAAMTSNSITGGNIFGESAGAASFQGAIADSFMYGRALTSTEVATLYGYAQTRGVSSAYTNNLLIDGDSISAGAGNTMNRNWVQQLTIPANTRVVNTSEASIQLATLVSEASTFVDPWLLAGAQNVLVLFAGTNDFQAGASEATILANTKTYCAARKSAGWNKIVVCTMLPRGVGGTFTQTTWNQFNSDINSSFGAGTLNCDAIADVAADPRIGNWGANTNLTYYAADQIHPNNAGSAIIAGIAQPAIQPFLGAASGAYQGINLSIGIRL